MTEHGVLTLSTLTDVQTKESEALRSMNPQDLLSVFTSSRGWVPEPPKSSWLKEKPAVQGSAPSQMQDPITACENSWEEH